jgi:protein O-mannosyl-transferase
LVALAFLPSVRNGFVDYDDDVYVTANTQVQSGLTLAGAVWTLGSTAGGNYWHPVTWLSSDSARWGRADSKPVGFNRLERFRN